MRMQIRRIGNSRGIILPSSMIEQTGLDAEVEVSIRDGAIELRAPRQSRRAGWEAAFAALGDVANEAEVGFVENRFDREDWTW